MSEDPDLRALLAAAQAGDRRAYRQVLRTILPTLRARARMRFPGIGPANLEDIVQDTLLALHQNLHLYDPSRPVLPFVTGIMRFRGVDLLRRRRRHGRHETPIETLPVTSPALAANAPQERDAESARIAAAIETLSDRDRTVLDALKARDLPLADAAAETGIGIGALKVASHRAMKRLRRALFTDEEAMEAERLERDRKETRRNR